MARSKNMAAIKSRDTGPEIFIRRCLFAKGYRYRVGTSAIPGHPDLYMAKYNLAVYIHGCFWHRHKGCKLAYTPGSRKDFWQAKFNKNIYRDDVVHKELISKGIRCLIIWECAIRKARKREDNQEELVRTIEEIIHSDVQYAEVEWDEGFKTWRDSSDCS